MKKTFGIFLLVAICVLTGCNGTAEKSKEMFKTGNPVNITLWHYYFGENQKSLDSAVEEFNKTVGVEEGIIVNAIAKGNSFELENAITDSADGLIDSEEMPDIFSAYPDKALDIYKRGLLCDLNKYFTENEKKEYIEGFIKDGIFEDKTFALMPIAKSTEVLYVNDSVYEKFAKDERVSEDALATFEGIYETARKFYDYTDKSTVKKGDGKSMIGFDSTASFFIIACKQLGIEVADAKSGKAVLDKKILKKVFENYYKGSVLGYYGSKGKYRTDDLKSGFIISYVGSSSGASYFPTWIEKGGKQKKIKFRVLDYPVFTGGSPVTIRQGAGMCVTKSNEEKEKAAVTFLKWFTGKDQNIKFARVSGYLPVKKDSYTSDLFEKTLNGDKDSDKAQKDDALIENVTKVYKLSMAQITENKTYSVKPFSGSYDIRKILASTVTEIVKADREKVVKMHKNNIFDENTIIKKLNFNNRFEKWFEKLMSNLKKQHVEYSVIS